MCTCVFSYIYIYIYIIFLVQEYLYKQINRDIIGNERGGTILK